MAEKTMTIELLTTRAAPTFAQVAGDEIEVPASEGKRLIEAGQAKPVAKVAAKRTEKRAGTNAEQR